MVLSAGGMFGAYQAGVWQALAGWFRPDVVVGASVGALNAWVIAGDAAPERLVEHWLDPQAAASGRLRLAQPPWRGCLDGRALHARIEALWTDYRPVREVGVVATELLRLRPVLFRGPEIGWRHLSASCAVLLCYPQVRIDGRLYTDGGLLSALPLWAAAAMGATRIVAVNSLPWMPSRVVRACVRCIRALSRPLQPLPEAEVVTIAPSQPLGSVRDCLVWREDLIRQWIELGRRDAGRVLAERGAPLSS